MTQIEDSQKYQKISITKIAVLAWIVWIILITGSITFNIKRINNTIFVLANIEAQTHFNKDTVYRRWSSLQGGVYVPISDYTPSNPHLAHLKNRDVTTQSGLRLTLVNPAYMTRQVHELSAEQYGIRGHITSLKPVRPETRPDKWEIGALLAFEKGASEIKSLEMIDAKPYLRFMRPFMVETGCLKCHGHQGYKEGDVRGGVSVSIPMDHYYELRNRQYKGMILWHLLIFGAGSFGLLFGFRNLHKKNVENRAAWQAVGLDRDRFASLLEISRMMEKTEDELIRFSLEEFIRLTRSQVGYFHFYDENTQNIQLYAWSQKVMEQCRVKKEDTNYPLENVGVWADCIRNRQPTIHNDYPNLAEKKGYPEGHFPMTRHLSIPVMDGERIIGIAGVANKETVYDQNDVTQLTLFTNTVWEIIKNIRAVSEIEKKEQGLQLFRALIDQSNDAIFIISPKNAQFLDVNQHACKMLGYTREELLSIGVPEIDVGLPENFTWEGHIKELRQRSNMLLESIHKRKDGTSFPVEINIKVFMLDNQEYMVAAARDITERKTAARELEKHRGNLERLVKERTEKLAARTKDLEKSQKALQYLLEDVNEAKAQLVIANTKLKELDRLKSMFIASMSHELRTPLNSIIGFSGLILGNMVGPISDEQKDMLTRVSKSGKHLLALITDVIDIAKIESGKIVPFPEEFELTDIVQEAVGQVETQAIEKGLVIQQRMPEEPIIMNTDRRHLLQCLLNFLSNAVKFSEKGVITIAVVMLQNVSKDRIGTEAAEAEAEKQRKALSEDWLEITVTDTGIGINEEDIKLLFRSFVRLKTNLKVITPGTGLGLYLTKKLANEVLGGNVGAESEEGKGSRFWLQVPVHLNVNG